jgi:hypothetical protein
MGLALETIHGVSPLAIAGDQFHLSGDQIGRERRQGIIFPERPAVLDFPTSGRAHRERPNNRSAAEQSASYDNTHHGYAGDRCTAGFQTSLCRRWGHERRFRYLRGTSAYPPRLAVKADIPDWQVRAKNGREQSQQTSPYSITSSAVASSVGGTSRPSALIRISLAARPECRLS